MCTELEYVDDPFEEDTSFRESETNFEKKLLLITSRRYFKKGEKKKAQLIEKRMHLDPQGKRHIPKKFMLGVLKWAYEKNRRQPFVIIKLPTVLGMLVDSDRLASYYERKAEAKKANIKPEDYEKTLWNDLDQ